MSELFKSLMRDRPKRRENFECPERYRFSSPRSKSRLVSIRLGPIPDVQNSKEQVWVNLSAYGEFPR